MNINIWVVIGIATSWAGYNIVLKRKSNQENSKNYYDYFADKKDKFWLDLKQILSIILYPFGYLFIIFSSKNYVLNISFVLLTNFVIYPLISGIMNGIDSSKKLNNVLKEHNIKLK